MLYGIFLSLFICNTNIFLLWCTNLTKDTKNEYKNEYHIFKLSLDEGCWLVDWCIARGHIPAGGSVAYEERWAVDRACAWSQRRSRHGATPRSFQAFRNPRHQKAQTKEEEKARKELWNPRWVDTDGRIHYYRDIILSDKSHRYILKLFRETSSSVEFCIGTLVIFQYIAVNVTFFTCYLYWEKVLGTCLFPHAYTHHI